MTLNLTDAIDFAREYAAEGDAVTEQLDSIMDADAFTHDALDELSDEGHLNPNAVARIADLLGRAVRDEIIDLPETKVAALREWAEIHTHTA